MIIILVVFALSIILFLHPYVTYPLSLAIVRSRGRYAIRSTSPTPERFAVVCCLHNENAVIEQKIQNMRALRQKLGTCQLLFHSDGSTDDTNEILRSIEGEFDISIAEKRGGKSAGMNRLISMTDAEIVIFTDANVIVDPETVLNMPKYFTDPEVGCVTGHLIYSNADESETARVGSLYWRFEEWVKQLESDTGSVMGADGSLFAIRRELHRPVPVDIIDDFCTSMSIVCSGHRIVRGHDFLAFERTATVSRDEFRRKVRIACRAFNCHRLLWPKIAKLSPFIVYKYLSHKYLRWLAAYFLVAGAASFGALVLGLFGFEAFLSYAIILAIVLIAASRLKLPVISGGWEMLLAMWATGYGVYKSLRGERFQTWSIAQSTRK